MDPLVLLTFILVSALQVAVPILIGYWLVRRYRLSWKLFGYGILFFIVVQIFHTPLVLLIQTPLADYLKLFIPDILTVRAAWALIIGLLAGLFEEIGRYLVFTKFFRRRKIPMNRGNAALLGAGWGGIESIAVAVLVFLTMFAYMAAAPLTGQRVEDINATIGGTLTDEQVEAVNTRNEALINLTPLELLPSLFERLMTITLHLAWTLMVFAAAIKRKKALLVLAILWHTAVDGLAVFIAPTWGVMAAELSILAFAALGLVYIRWQWNGLKK